MQIIPEKEGRGVGGGIAARFSLLGRWRRTRGCCTGSAAWLANWAAAGTNTGASARSVEPARVAEVEN